MVVGILRLMVVLSQTGLWSKAKVVIVFSFVSVICDADVIVVVVLVVGDDRLDEC